MPPSALVSFSKLDITTIDFTEESSLLTEIIMAFATVGVISR